MTRVAGHFGEWLQGLMDGQVVLVTVACDALAVSSDRDGTALFPNPVLRAFADSLGLAGPLPKVRADMPAGGGAGASTAALVAVARAMGFQGRAEQLAQACLAVEGACDPVMFDAPDCRLWASRAAHTVADLPPPPPCTVVGGFWGAPERTDPNDSNFDDVGDLVTAWRSAVAAQDLGAAAAVATQSAQRCDARRGGAGPMTDLRRSLGALGELRAHTGSARGLIFARGAVPDQALPALRAAGLTDVLRFDTGGAP